MRKSPPTPVDRTSQTYNDASDIIGSGKSSAIPPPPATRATPAVHSFDGAIADNGGITVSHYPVDKKGGGQDYQNKKTNVFADPHAAHAHIGKLLGVHGGGKGAGGLT